MLVHTAHVDLVAYELAGCSRSNRRPQLGLGVGADLRPQGHLPEGSPDERIEREAAEVEERRVHFQQRTGGVEQADKLGLAVEDRAETPLALGEGALGLPAVQHMAQEVGGRAQQQELGVGPPPRTTFPKADQPPPAGAVLHRVDQDGLKFPVGQESRQGSRIAKELRCAPRDRPPFCQPSGQRRWERQPGNLALIRIPLRERSSDGIYRDEPPVAPALWLFKQLEQERAPTADPLA